jgi:hypothetical protein
MSDLQKVPRATGADAVHTLAKAGLSAIPMVGGPAAELFQFLVQPPLEKRRIKWMEQVANNKAIGAAGVDIDSL